MNASLLERCLAELAGTAILVALGTGAIVAAANVGGLPQWALAVAWFAAVAIPIQLFAPISGAHLNPAVTLGLVAGGRFPPREAAAFVLAQLAGAFVGSLAVLALVGGNAHLGSTLPGPTGPFWVFPLELTFTLLLVLSVLVLAALGRRPNRIELLLPAAVVGAATWLIGPLTGSSLNPARSIAPAVVSGDLAWLWLYLLAGGTAALMAGVVMRRRRR